MCVIGGAQLYAAALPRADVLELTEIDVELAGDTVFPAWNRTRFEAVSRAPRIAADGTHYAFVTWRRRAWARGRHGVGTPAPAISAP